MRIAFYCVPVFVLACCVTVAQPVLADPVQDVSSTAAAVSAAAPTSVDLILPPSLESADAPFYRGAQIKIGDRLVPITEGPVTGAQLAQYDPEHDIVVISNAATASEIAKGQALMDVMAALQINDIATAAGR